MTASVFEKLYHPRHMVKSAFICGELPSAKAAYSTALATAWPAISETFLVALMSMADTVMVGAIGPEAIASVGLVTQPRFLALALIMSLNVAVTSICARRKGENDQYGAVHCLKQSLIISLGLSIVTAAVFLMFSRQLLTFAGAQADTIEDSMRYFNILLYGLPINAIQLTICAAQRGIGQTRISMYINMLANCVNLVLNYLLIGGRFGFPRLGVTGAAIATVIGMACGMVLGVISISGRDRFLFVFTREDWRFDRKTLSSMYMVASGTFGEQVCMRIGFFVYAIIIANLGTIMFAAHQIFMNVLSLSFSLGEGFGIAATSLVGQNLGAKRPDLSTIYGKVCQRMSFLTCVAVSLVFIFAGNFLVGIFTDDARIFAVAGPVLLAMSVVVLAQSSQMIMLGCLRGAGDTRFTAIVSLVSIVILRPLLGWLFAFPLGMGLIGMWIGFIADQYVRLVLTMGRFSSGKWMNIKL